MKSLTVVPLADTVRIPEKKAFGGRFSLSDGDKKPGLKDISSLKARLGMLSKAKARPAAPAPRESVASPFAQSSPSPQVDLTGGGGDIELGSDTAIVRIDSPAAAPAEPAESPTTQQPAFDPMAFGPPAGQGNPFAPSPAPSPSPAPAGGLGENLFAAPPAQAAPAAQPRSVAQKAADQAAAEALFAAQAAAEAPPPAQQQNTGFAHPLQRGAYVEAAAPVDLSAQEQEALDSFEGQQRGIKRSLAITMTLVVGLITLGFGFFIGDVRSARRLVNAQIDESIKVKELMEPGLKRLGEVEKYIEAMAKNPGQVNWAAIDAIPKKLDGVSPSVTAARVPLDKDLARMVGTAAVDFNMLFTMLLEHRNTTLKRKAEIEALNKGEGFFTNTQFAIYSQPPADPTKPVPFTGRPPSGRVVALKGKPVKDDKGEYIMPVRYRSASDDKNVLLRGITLVPKTDLQASGSSNVLKLYQRRVENLVTQMKRIKVYEKTLRDVLDQQAGRTKVFSF